MPGEGLDQSTGMGKWGSVVRTEEGEDVDHVRWSHVVVARMTVSAVCIVCLCKREGIRWS